MAAERICVVEDEADIAEILRYNLAKEGFEVEVFPRGDQALEAILQRPPDLILLDLMLPGVDGLEITRVLQRGGSTAGIPLLMLTARNEEVDRIVGLELGADDYIPKPFSPREVVLRVKAVLRRRQLGSGGASNSASASSSSSASGSGSGSGGAGDGEVLQAGGIHLDLAAHRLRVGREEVVLTATEFKLLRVLLERRERVQTRARLLSDVWGYADDVDSRTVDTHIRRLRRKLGEEAERIETVIGVGYRMRT